MRQGTKGIKYIVILLVAILVASIVAVSIICSEKIYDSQNSSVNLLSYDLDNKISVNDMTFTTVESNHTATFTGLKSTVDTDTLPKTLDIPKSVTINDVVYTVNKIEEFDSANKPRLGYITALIVPKTVTYIAPKAFEPFVSLQYISVPFVGTARGNDDNEAPFASMFSERQTSIQLAVSKAYPTTINGLNNKNNISPWYEGDNINGATEFHYSLPEQLSTVVITDETYLPDRPFFGISSLVSVTFEKVTSLNSIAMFHNCTSLTDVYLPDQVQGLGEYMFGNCYALEEVTIPYGIREIPPYMFTGCNHLETVIVPSTIETVSEGAFYQCVALENIKRYGSNRNLVVTEEGFDLPNSVKTIGPRAFFGCKFTIVNMSALTSLTSIGSSAFQACNYITAMSLPFIGYERGNTEAAEDKAMFGYIFGNTGGGTIQAYNDTTAANQSYAIPSSLKSIVITNETYVARGALSNFAYVETIVLNDAITQISERALEGCTALTDLTVPFAGNYQTDSNLASKYFYKIFGPNSKTGTYNVGGYYVPSLLAKYKITNQKYIWSGTLHSFTSLEVLEISDKTYQLDEQILYNNNKLREITLPFVGWQRGERAISHYSEWWLTQRRKNSVSWIFSLTSSGSEEYLNDTMRYYDSYRVCIPKSLRSITITDETVIGTWSFRSFRSITDLAITNNPSYVAEQCAYDCGNIERLTIPYIGSDSNPSGTTARNYTLGWMFGTADYTNSYSAYQYGYYYRLPSKLTNVTVNPYTVTVPGYGFANARTITAITLEGAISKVSAHAFENCSSLAHLVAKEAVYTTVGDYAFSGCSKVAVLYQANNDASFIPATVTEIGAYAFQGTAISSIDFDQFHKIGDYAFRNCLEITTIAVPDITHESTLESFGEGVFEGCAYLTTATIGEGTATKALFRNCTSLREIDLTGITTKVPDYMFSGCLSLETVTLDDDTTVIGYQSFYNCKSLKSFLIQSHIREIKDYAFAGCTGLENMTIPRNVITIGVHGWENCNDDFYFFVYDPEADWSQGWSDNWNCSYPVYIIGQADEAMFKYEYFADLKGYLIKSVADGVQLSDQVRLPTKHNGVKIMGLMEDALANQFKMTSVILGEYTRVIGDGALQNGKSLKVYIDVPSTSSQVVNAAGENYEPIITREYDWLSSGIIYYGEYWDYAGTNVVMPYLLASKFVVEVDTDYDYYYDGTAHTPDIKSVTIQGHIVDTDGLLNLEKYNDVDVNLFNIEYVDNIVASTTDRLAKAKLTTNATKLNNRNANYDKLLDKLYMTGTATGTFVVNKKIIDIYPNGGHFEADYGTGWSNYRWDDNNTEGLEDTNFVLTGHLTTEYNDADTYKSVGVAGLGEFTHFKWITAPRVYLGGTDVTVNFTFELNSWGGTLDCPYLEVVIHPLDVMVQWTGGSWSQNNIFYLWPYTGNPISPTATAKTKTGAIINNIINAYADVTLADEIPVYPSYWVDDQGVEHVDPLAGPYPAKAVLTSTKNYNLVRKVGETYEDIEYETVNYHVKKGLITIDLHDTNYLIGYNEDYWSKISTATNSWVNEYTDTYSITGINSGSIFVGELRSANNNKGTHLANTSINWVPKDFKTSTNDAETLPFYIYREIREVEGEGNNATVKITRVDENNYYDVVVSGQIYIVYNTFDIKYYVDEVDANHRVNTTVTYDGQGRRIDRIVYQTEGKNHLLIAHVENDGIAQDVLIYRYDSSTESPDPLPFTTLGTYAVGVEAQRKNFDTYYTNINLEVIKSDIILGEFDQEYDGQPIDGYSRVLKISNPLYDNLATAQYNSLTFTYYKASDTNFTKPIAAPSAVGDYVVFVYADPSEYFNGIETEIEFSIRRRQIIIDVRDPNNTINDEIENNNAYAENKVYDTYIYSVVVQLDSTNSNVLATDQLTGVLKTVSAIPQIYNSEDTETTYWYWSPQWAVYNKSTKENVTSSYEVVLKGSFEILNRTIIYTKEDDLDAPFDGYPHKILVDVQSPLTGTTIYYTTTPCNNEEGDHDIKWSVINPTYTTPGEYLVYFKIVGEYYTTIYDHAIVRIVEKTITYELPDLVIDYDSFDHEFIIEPTDPYYALVEYSEDGTTYTEFPPILNEMKVYKIYYRITAPNYKTVDTFCEVEVTDDNLIEIVEGTHFTIADWEGPYNGLAHYPEVTLMSPLSLANTTIYYRLDEDQDWTVNLNLTEAGTYDVWVKIFSPGYKVFTKKCTVKITPKTFDGVTVTEFEGFFDRKYHSVTITGLDQYESYGYTVYYSRDYNSQDSGDGWSTTQIRFKNASVSAIPVYIKISAPNFVDYYASSYIFVKVSPTPPSVVAKETCMEFEYQGQPLSTNQIRSIFNTVHDGDIIIKHYLADYDEFFEAYTTSMEKIPFAQELGYYYVEVQFVKSNNCLATSSTAYFRIVPRKLYPIYEEEIQYTGYKINPVFTYSIVDPNAAPAQPLPEDEDDDFPIDIEPIVDVETEVLYVLTGAPDDAEEMLELGEYEFTLSLYPNTGNYVLATPVVNITVVPQEIKIYMRETGDYSVGNPWVKSSDEAPNDKLGGFGNYIAEGHILDGHKLKMKVETSSYEQQTYVYVENPQGAQSNYILVTYDVVKVDAQGNEELDEENEPISVLKYYHFTFDIKVKIQLAELDYTFEDIIIEYDGNAHTPLVVINDPKVQNAKIYYSLDDPDDPETGAHWLSALPSYTDAVIIPIYLMVISDNYDPLIASIKFEIKMAHLKIDVDDFDETYSDEDYEITYTATNSVGVSVTNLPEAYNVLYYPTSKYDLTFLEDMYDAEDYYNDDYLNAATCMHNAGEYYVVVLYRADLNWHMSYGIEKVTLKRRPLHITLPQNQVKTSNYNGEYQFVYLSGATYETADLVPGHAILTSKGINSLRTISANAGTYTAEMLEFESIYIYDVDHKTVNLYMNYYPVVTNEISIVINKIPFTFSVLGGEFPYSANEDKTDIKLAQPIIYDPSYGKPKLYFDNPAHFTYYEVDEYGNPTICLGIDNVYDVGTYYVVVQFDEGTNYLEYSDDDVAAIVTITPVEVEVIWENKTLEFNNTYQAPKVTYLNVLDEPMELVPVLQKKVSTFDLNGVETVSYDYVNSVLLAGSYKAYAEFATTDILSMNYVLKANTINSIFKITPVTYTIDVNDISYNRQDVWNIKVYPSDLEGFLDGMSLTNSFDGGDYARLATKSFAEGRYLVSDEINDVTWTYTVIGKDNIDVTNSVILSAMGYVIIYQDKISVEINEELLTVTYDTQIHTIEDAITVLNPSAGYNILYSTDGEHFYTTVPEYVNVGEYPIWVSISAFGYNEPVEIERVFKITQAQSVLTVSSTLDRVYSATKVNTNTLNITGVYNGTRQDLKFDFYETDENNVLMSNIPLDETPINVGYYAMRITNSKDGPTANYTTLEKWYYFRITPKTAYLKLDIDQIVTKNQVGQEEYTLVVTNQSPLYMQLCSNDFLDYRIQTSSAIKRDSFVINTEFKEGNKDETYYLEATKYLAFKYYIHNTETNPETDNTMNYTLKVTGNVTLRFAYIEFEINDETFNFDNDPHYGTITHNYGSDLKQSYTYGTLNSDDITAINFINPGTYTVSYELKLDGHEDAVGTYKITIGYLERTRDESIPLAQEKFYDGIAVTAPQYAFVYAANSKPDNFDENAVVCRFQKVGTNGTINQITEVGNYSYTLIIPASTYYAQTIIVGTFRIISGVIKVEGSYSGENSKFNGNTISYHYTVASQDFTASLKVSNSDNYVDLPTGYTVTFDLVTESPAIGTYRTKSNTLYLRNGFVVKDSSNNDLTNNYSLELDCEIVIGPGEMVFTVNDINVEFDQQIHMPTVTMVKPSNYTELYYSLSGNPGTYTTAEIGSPNVGSYTVYLRIVRTNYEDAYATATVNISKATTYLIIPEMGKVYDGNEVLLPSDVGTNTTVDRADWNISYYQYDEESDMWFDLEDARPIDVGKYKILVEVPTYDEYGDELSSEYTGASKEVEFYITPVTLAMNWNGTTFTYDGDIQLPTYTVTAMVQTSLDVTKVKPAINVYNVENPNALVDPIDVGVYVATADVTSTGNYVISDNYRTTTFSIRPRTIVVSANQQVIYSGSKFVLNYEDENYPYYVSNLCEDHIVYNSPLTTTTHVTGLYAASGDTLDNTNLKWVYNDNIDIRDKSFNNVIDNYKVEYDISFTIDFNEVLYQANNYYGEYDGFAHTINVVVNNVSNYTITYAHSPNDTMDPNNPNYDVYVASLNLIYSETPQKFTDVEKDQFDNVVVRRVRFKINVEGYAEVNGFATVTITPQTAALALASQKPLSKIYDGQNIEDPEVVYNGMEENPRTVTYSYYKYTTEDKAQYEKTDATRDVGEYRLEISLATGSNLNYIGGDLQVDFSVVKRDVTIAIYNLNNQVIAQSKVYDGNIMKLEVGNDKVKNLVDGETFTGTVTTKLAVVGNYDKASDFNLTYKVERVVQAQGNNPSILDVSQNYNVKFDLDLRITKANIEYKDDDVEAYFNGYMHKYEVTVIKPAEAIVYYWTIDDMTPTTTPYEQKYRGTTTVYYHIVADNYEEVYGNGILNIIGISSTVGDDTPLIYDDTKAYDTKPYMYNADVTLAHPRIVTESTGNQVIRYYRKQYPNTVIATVTYAYDGTLVGGDVDSIPTNAGDYLFKIKVEADNEYEEIVVEKAVSFSITKIDRAVTWSNLTQTYTGSPIAPTATYTNYVGDTVTLDVITPQTNVNTLGYSVTAAAKSEDTDTSTNYNLTNANATFKITPIEVEELNLQKGRSFKYRETIAKDTIVYEYDEEGNHVLDDNDEYKYDIFTSYYEIGDVITIIDVQGNQYIVDDNGNITDVLNSNGDSIYTSAEDYVYTINILGDGNATRMNTGADLKFVVSLKDTTNYIWKAAQSSSSLVTTYEIDPFDIDDPADNYQVMITLPSYVLYTGFEIKPNVKVTLTTSNGTTLRDLTTSEYDVIYAQNVSVGKDATVTVTGKGNFDFKQVHNFEIRAEDPERFELLDTATIKFVEYIRGVTEAGKTDYKIDATQTSTMDNPDTDIGEETIFLGRLHQSQTLLDVLNQFVRFDTNPELFRVWNSDGVLIEAKDYGITNIATGYTIKLYSKSSDEDDKYVDYIRTVLYGDLNGDGKVAVADYGIMKKVVLNMTTEEELGIFYLAGLIYDSTSIGVATCASFKKYNLNTVENDFNANYLINVDV